MRLLAALGLAPSVAVVVLPPSVVGDGWGRLTLALGAVAGLVVAGLALAARATPRGLSSDRG